ncbi:uncharacterized protein [Elaeis guineensis]|uniref:uncharacterized protein isoform X3 n=1 Tax=Elaeis guineensis var. tenera TaxID=51953 RepID=UPI003C6D6145
MGFLLKVGGASSSCSILGNSVESVPESEPSWAQVVQGRRCFMWEMPRPSQEDISILEAKFNDLVVFSEVELQRTSKKWKTAAVGKFLGQGFPLEFVQKELKNRCSWRVTFRQLLALECWRPNFKPSKDSINKVNVWLRLPDLPLEGPHAYHCLRAYGYLVQCYISLILELADHSTHGEQTGCFSSQLYDLYLIGAMLLLTSFMCLFFIYSAWLTSSQRIRRLLRFSCTIPPTTRFRLFGACVYSFLILQLLLLQFSLCDWTHRMLSSDGLGERINTEAFSSLASLNSLISMNI